MDEHHGPDRSDLELAAAVDDAAVALLSVWDGAREQLATRLSGSQLRALLAVEDNPGINLGGLASRLTMILSSASRLCDRLVAAGLLERETSRLDRREIALNLTAAGAALLFELRAERRRRLAGVLAKMSVGGRAGLLRGLREFGVTADAPATPSAQTA
ncbi:MAG TPA: MarR family transcriptional regulator [Pilimelia sp.]|nr:MarR family transcriptional regulator [Pilimelia sp.]